MDGVRRLYAFTKFCCPESGDLFLRIGIPRSVAFADANRMLIRNLIMLGVVALLALGIAWGGARVLVLKPVQALLGAIKRYDAGDFGARTGLGTGVGELSSVGSALDTMAATVEAREKERDRSVVELRRESARSEAMALIAARLNAQVHLEGVLNTVCQETARALSVQAASVSLCGVDQGCMHLATCWGLSQDFCERVHASAPAAFAPIQEGRPVSVADVGSQLEQSDAALFSELDVRSFVGAPMLQEGELIGALFVFARGEQRQFSDDEIVFLRAISDQAATAVANARLYESLRQEERARADLLRGLISAQEDERKRIARELHDETSQELGALMVELESAILAQAAGVVPNGQHLQSAKSIARRMMLEIRRLVSDLRPALLDDLGLVPAIAWYVEQRLEAVGIGVTMRTDPEEIRLPQSLEITLFRVAQEAISNIIKHSGASSVSISLTRSEKQVSLLIEDNGRGFDASLEGAGKVNGGGFGLQSIRERVSIVGGELTVRSAPGQGTLLEVSVPLTQGGGFGAEDQGSTGR
jgi:signal transduction histidine kinase